MAGLYISSRSCEVHCFEGPWMKRTIPHKNVPWQASNTQSGGAHILPGPWIESTWLSRGCPPNAKGCCASPNPTSEKCGVWLHCWSQHFESLVGKAWEQDEEGSVWQFLTGWQGMTPSDASYKRFLSHTCRTTCQRGRSAATSRGSWPFQLAYVS